MTSRKLGLRPRKFNSAIPHYSAFAAIKPHVTAPISVNNYAGMPTDIDLLGNADYGDCADAATYREVEILSYGAQGAELKASTALALQLYSETTGFDPKAGPVGNNPTDQGTVMQDLLTYRVKTGIPLPDGSRSNLLAFFELDPRNLNDVRWAIADGGAIQIGINCYSNFMNVQQGGVWAPPTVADSLDGGHAICCGWYEPDHFVIKSWAMDIQVPLATWYEIVTECYCVVSPHWVAKTGKTPLGMSLDQLTAAMRAL